MSPGKVFLPSLASPCSLRPPTPLSKARDRAASHRPALRGLLWLLALLLADGAWAKPVTEAEARAATAILIRDSPGVASAKADLKGPAPVITQRMETLNDGPDTIGYVSHFEPGGFVLVRADDRLAPVKLRSETDRFADLPPAFHRLLRLELRQECEALRAGAAALDDHGAANQARWQALLQPDQTLDFRKAGTDKNQTQVGPLLETAWSQESPYNFYCPPVDTGSEGRAYVGCVACALAQILRFHQQPSGVAANRTYTDSKGTCQGTFSMSDAGLENYRWASMPATLHDDSPSETVQATAQLMYHCAVSVTSDFGGRADNGTPALSFLVPVALKRYFGFSSSLVNKKDGYTRQEWWDKITAEIDAGRPVFYGLSEADGANGHAAVCDGYRQGGEMHLNLGWAGSDNLWYDVDIVEAAGYQWVQHFAFFGVAPVSPVPDELRLVLDHADPVEISVVGRAGLQVAIEASADFLKGWEQQAVIRLQNATGTNVLVTSSWHPDTPSPSQYYRARVLP